MPVRHAAAGDVARADREVGTVVDRAEQPRDVGRVVREVGVDLDHHVVAAREPGREALAVRAPEPHLPRPAQHVDAADLGRRAPRPCRRCRRGCCRRRRGSSPSGAASRTRRTTRSMFSTSWYVGIVTQTSHRTRPSCRARGPVSRGPRAIAKRTGVVGVIVRRDEEVASSMPGADPGRLRAEQPVHDRQRLLVASTRRPGAGCGGGARADRGAGCARRSRAGPRSRPGALSSPSRPRHSTSSKNRPQHRHELRRLEQVDVERVLEVGGRVGRDHERGAVRPQDARELGRRAAPGSRSAR